MKVGFVGLGIMGGPMARNLLTHGYPLTVYDVNEEAVRALTERGAQAASSPKEVAAHSEVVITMLPTNRIVKEVILGENGLCHGASPGTIVIDMSSTAPAISRELAEQLRPYGLHMLDAPVSGGEPKAIDGTLAIMVGGEEHIFQKVKPLLCCMGEEVILVGSHGSGSTAKLANQIMVNVNIAAMCEALVLAAKSGIDIEKMYQAVRSGLAGSAVLDAKVPMILERNFKAGGRIDINMKDLTNVLETAKETNVKLPLTSQVLNIFASLVAAGKQADDHCGIIQYYEELADVVVGKTATS